MKVAKITRIAYRFSFVFLTLLFVFFLNTECVFATTTRDVYVDPDAVGTGDGTSWANAYTSLFAAEAGEQGDITLATGSDEIVVIHCKSSGGTADTTAVTIDGWTTSATNYIEIKTDAADRHAGVWDDTKYRLTVSVNFTGVLNIISDYIKITGLQIKQTGSGGGNRGVVYNGAGSIDFSNNIVTSTPIGTIGVDLDSNNNTFTGNFYNNIIYDWSTVGLIWSFTNGVWSGVLYNNTIIDTNVGIQIQDDVASNNVYLKNNLIQTSGSNYLYSNIEGSSNNISSDTTSPNDIFDSLTVSFENSSLNNFHLASGDTSAKDAGTDLSADANLAFSTDIDGDTRSGSWDIGADEYVSAGDSTAPTITGFVVTSTATSSRTAIVNTFTATDAVGVTGYLVNETITEPSLDDAAWKATATTSYTFSSDGSKTLYAWAKDAAGNISASSTDSIVIDTVSPTVDSFIITSTATSSLTVTVNTFTASDSVGVTGYLVNESASTPALDDVAWKGTATTSYTFSSAGSKTLYAWAKDAVGNISSSASDTVTVDVTNPSVSVLSPLDNATGVSTSANLVITFTETVATSTGNIVIYETVGDGVFETIDVTSSLVTGYGTDTITINPAGTFASATEYYVQIASTAFDDSVGNSYAGIADTTSWSFTTASSADVTSPSSFSLSSPSDGSSSSDSTPTFSWSSSSDANFSHYTLYIDSAVNTDNISGTSQTVTSSLGCGSHSWYVKASDTSGNSTNSSTYNFTVSCGGGGVAGAVSTQGLMSLGLIPTPRLQRVVNGVVTYLDVETTQTSVTTTYSNNLSTVFYFNNNLYTGLENEEVRNLQKALRNLGLFNYPTDTGRYGKVTREAVQSFQCNYNIVCSGTVDTTGYGVFGPKTREKFNELYEGQTIQTQTSQTTQQQANQQNIVQLEQHISPLLKMVDELTKQLEELQ